MPGRTVVRTTRRQKKQLRRWCGSTRPRGSVGWLRARSSVVAPPWNPSGWRYRRPSRKPGAPLAGPFLQTTRFASAGAVAAEVYQGKEERRPVSVLLHNSPGFRLGTSGRTPKR